MYSMINWKILSLGIDASQSVSVLKIKNPEKSTIVANTFKRCEETIWFLCGYIDEYH